jgi:hypothetical protein
MIFINIPIKTKVYILFVRLFQNAFDKIFSRFYFLLTWLTINTILSIKLALDRLSKKSTKSETQIWICGSKIHLLLALSKNLNKSVPLIFNSETLKISNSSFSSRIEIKNFSLIELIKTLAIQIIRFEDFRIFVPHISPYMFSEQSQYVLWKLWESGLISYFDDGMSLISKNTHLFKDGYIPAQIPIISWNYRFIDSSCPEYIVSTSSLMSLIKQGSKSIDLSGRLARNSYHSIKSQELTIIVASKWMDNAKVNKLLDIHKTDKQECIYFPHYLEQKNSPDFLENCFIPKFEFLEYELISLFRFDFRKKRIIFGVTSTLILLLDLVSKKEINSFDANFVGSDKLAGENGLQEYRDYLKILRFYGVNLRELRP